MAKSSLRKFRTLSFVFLIVTSFIVTFRFMHVAWAETKIGSISPTSGFVGATVQVTGNISNINGTFIIRFEGVNLTTGTAVGKLAVGEFTVPDAIAGNHTVELLDVTSGEKDSQTFRVSTEYPVEIPVLAEPTQRQEGDSINITAKITGGADTKQYTANVTVRTPANATYQKMVNLVTSTYGNASATMHYPEDFPSGANTNSTGDYGVYYNTTSPKTTFYVGLTNASKYHRKQVVDIKALYRASESVTIKIVGTGVNNSTTMNATASGIVQYNWVIPTTVSIGSYKVTVNSTSGPTNKKPADVQNFTVPGFGVNVTAKNRAGEPVQSVTIRVYENSKSVANRTTNTDGMVFPALTLEIGIYNVEAFYRNTKVGQGSLNVTKAESKVFTCNLTNLRITVTDEDGVGIPEVDLYLTRENLTLATHINGTTTAHSLVPSVSYTVNASRYDALFNTTTIQQLPITAWYDVKIVCPKLNLQMLVVDVKGNLINNASVTVQEMMGGPPFESRTVNGIASFHITFGSYMTSVTINSVLVNETLIALFKNQNVTINCVLYGISVTIKVVDYFGQPIPNVNVTLHREGLTPQSIKTNASGIAEFNQLIGGKMQASLYLSDGVQPFTVASYTVSSSSTFEIRLDAFVNFAGFLVQTGQLATALVIIAVLVIVVVMEIYLRRRSKPQKTS